jgi:4-diphosphocytidyl-2-C-methyl-D-erythritol kinase
MPLLRLAAPAKLNLYLEILGTRADGFHDLETVFQTVDLHDEITLALGPGRGIHLACDHPALPVDRGNLAWRAAEAFLGGPDEEGRIEIGIVKRIPLGAGLGGGSSDAAAVLRGLARLQLGRRAPANLARLAAGLGADVAFFLTGGTTLGTGRGERLEELPDLPRTPVTVLMPQASLPTPAVYRALHDEERGPRSPRGPAWWRALASGDLATHLHNRLTGPATRLCRPVAELLDWLGGQGVPHLMSGSGAACFALAHLDPPPGVTAWRTWFRPRARLDDLE